MNINVFFWVFIILLFVLFIVNLCLSDELSKGDRHYWMLVVARLSILALVICFIVITVMFGIKSKNMDFKIIDTYNIIGVEDSTDVECDFRLTVVNRECENLKIKSDRLYYVADGSKPYVEKVKIEALFVYGYMYVYHIDNVENFEKQ